MPVTMAASASPTYWDTSALLKCYAPEPDSAAYRALLCGRPRVVISFIHRIEMAYALQHKGIRGEILPTAADGFITRFERDSADGRFVVLPWGDDLVQAAREVLTACTFRSERIPIRTLDGIHLAAARVAGLRSIVTTDRRMRAAAEAIGMTAVDP
jgi:predicted nucleic acid-binding protein